VYVLANKVKGQSGTVAKPELLALVFTFGGLAERSNAADCKSANGATNTVLGFGSLTRRQIGSPAKALTSARESKRTAEAARTLKFSIRLLPVELNRRFHGDSSQLPPQNMENIGMDSSAIVVPSALKPSRKRAKNAFRWKTA
jgi:hypothetical protein